MFTTNCVLCFAVIKQKKTKATARFFYIINFVSVCKCTHKKGPLKTHIGTYRI